MKLKNLKYNTLHVISHYDGLRKTKKYWVPKNYTTSLSKMGYPEVLPLRFEVLNCYKMN